MNRGGRIAVIGGGPAGLMASEVLASAGQAVTLYDHMPSFGRKLLLAGRGGLNLTHSEDLDSFLPRYGAAAPWMAGMLAAFSPADLRGWAAGLGIATFIGSSGRVFPVGLKTSPLLRAWLARLQGLGVGFAPRHHWLGWDEAGQARFRGPAGAVRVAPAATVLALGGASWPRMGSDGGWVDPLARAGAAITPLRPANCGLSFGWSAMFRDRFAGAPLKSVQLRSGGAAARGDAMVTQYGLEGGPVYALGGQAGAMLEIDLRPDIPTALLAARLGQVRARESLANTLRRCGFSAVETHLLRECLPEVPRAPAALAEALKCLRLTIAGTQGLARAISTAGGVALSALDAQLMLRARPGVFVAGEMLDWDAPTGGYLLQASLATGRAAGLGALAFVSR